MKYQLLTSAALAALALGATAQATEASDSFFITSVSEVSGTSARFTPQYGDLDTFYGDLDTFYGDLDTFYGDLDTFYGDLDTFYGDLDTFYGDLDTFYGDLDTFYGDLDTFYGDLDTFWGNLGTFFTGAGSFYGDLDTFYGDLDTFYGDLDTFYGPLDVSYGDLDTFYGDLDTFAGNLDTSYGDLDTFWNGLSAFYGDLDTFYGDLDTFYGDLDTFWGGIDTLWGDLDTFSEENAADYEQLLAELGDFYNLSQEQFAIPVALKTRQDFWTGFASGIFAKYGIDPTDASTLSGLDAITRAKFFVDWYDGLMQFSGIDRVDHWMGAINWSPALTQDHDFNSEAVIGLLDFGVTDETLLTHDVIYKGGYDTDLEDTHGSAVISLMIAPHDGAGVMGIAPNASVATYNPFDDTKTAGFEDVELGIAALIQNNARIINMSLGVPGAVLTEEWSPILDRFVSDPASGGTIFVKAAGNEGVVQTVDIDWENAAALERLILVGATGVDGEIAEWSNTPGEACALFDGICDEENKLKYSFIVAPGEFILVSDGQGGVTRQSGTSFAAPLVSGTAALIHGAWPWWKDHGEETVEVILKSATDLGEEGVDGTYGWGMLNVEGALSPLDWNDLRFHYAKSADGRLSSGKSANWIQKAYLRADVLDLEADGAYVVALEQVGDTFRDFRIPLSSQLNGATSDLDGHARERRFQRHLYQRFTDWATGSSFGDTQGYVANLDDRGDWVMSMTARPYVPGTDVRDGDLPFQTDFVMTRTSTGAEIRVGYGDGASRLSNSKVFGFYSDYDVETGGVNPLLGLASGGSYVSGSVPLMGPLSIAAAVTQVGADNSYLDPLTGLRVEAGQDVADYAAQAANVSLRLEAMSGVRLNLDYTQLHERDSLLGDQGSGFFALEGGAVTDALTFGAEADLPAGFAIATSATMGKTRQTRFDGGFLSVGDKGLQTSSFAIGLEKDGVFGSDDHIRFAISQPLRLDSGALNFTALEVVDRETGELGQVTQSWSLGQSDRELSMEAIYAISIFDGAGDFSAFTRTGASVSSSNVTGDTETSIGARVTFRY